MRVITFIKNKIQSVSTKVISSIFSYLFCIVGIGCTSVVAKLVGKNFLCKKYIDSSWVKTKGIGNLKKQY